MVTINVQVEVKVKGKVVDEVVNDLHAGASDNFGHQFSRGFVQVDRARFRKHIDSQDERLNIESLGARRRYRVDECGQHTEGMRVVITGLSCGHRGAIAWSLRCA